MGPGVTGGVENTKKIKKIWQASRDNFNDTPQPVSCLDSRNDPFVRPLWGRRDPSEGSREDGRGQKYKKIKEFWLASQDDSDDTP